MTDAINLLARGYRVDVSADGSTNWLQVKGLNDLNPQITPNKQDSSNYDSDGWAASEITMQAWTVGLKFNRQTTSGVEDAAQKLLRDCIGEFGDDARVYVRWYSTNTDLEAFSGRAIVELTPSKTGVADLSEMQVTLTGDGELSKISNPYSASLEPVIASATPSAVAEGGQVQIVGQNFTGTVTSTGVKFGSTAATSWLVVSDSLIVAIMPSGSAGAANITVTNATGASDAFSYTRGA